MKLDILAFGAHPDDIELSCGGTLIKHIQMGKKVGLVDLTRGELGTRGSAELRDQEATAASKIIGASIRVNLGLADGFFVNDHESQIAVIEIIRLFQPEIVLANAIADRHPDHARGAKLVADACFYAGLSKIETEWDGVPQEKWRPKVVYHYIQDHYHEPDFVVDITGYEEKKMEAIKAYKSQFHDPNSTAPQTPISGADFMEFINARALEYGRPAGFTYAEGFTVNRTPGISNFWELK